jgi:hypothetical protein
MRENLSLKFLTGMIPVYFKVINSFFNVIDLPQNVIFSRIFSPTERPGRFPKIEKKSPA